MSGPLLILEGCPSQGSLIPRVSKPLGLTNQSRAHLLTTSFLRFSPGCHPPGHLPSSPGHRSRTARDRPGAPEPVGVIQTGQSHACLPCSAFPKETTTDALVHSFPSSLCLLTGPGFPRQLGMAQPAPPLRTRSKLPLPWSSSLDLRPTPE